MEDSPESRTLGDILEDKVKLKGDSPFFYFEDKIFSYRDVDDQANRVAGGYQSIGVQKGDRVIAMLPNCPELIFHWFGLAKLGAVDTSINTAYKGDLLTHVINISGAKVMLIFEDFMDRIKFVANDLSSLEKLVVLSPSGLKFESTPKFENILFEELTNKRTEISVQEKIKPSDPLMIIFTSGTTGPSKGAVLSHQALYYYGSDTIEYLGLRDDDIIYSNLPLYHINIRFFTVMTSLLNGGSFAMTNRFSATRFWDEVRKFKATAFSFPAGALISFIVNQPVKDNDGDNPVRLTFMGPISGERAQEFEKRFNLKVYLGYFGMTEANYITSLNVTEMDRLKEEGKWEQALGMGRENPERYQVKLVDENDNEVPVGEAGEIVCRPVRPYSMMMEYIGMPEKTLDAFKNLWFHTGDMGKKDDEGFFYYVDRKKDYIRRRGENVSSFEVEKVINTHPSVDESAVIGVKSEMGEEEIKAIVVLKEGKQLTYEELMNWCDERMAHFMVPRFIHILHEPLPKTPSGRVQKYKLKELEFTADIWDREKAGYKLKK